MNKVVEYTIMAVDKTHSAINGAIGKLQDFAKGVFSNLANIKAGFDMARGAITTVASAIASTIGEAFKFETTTLQFSILMGSMKSAKERMKELGKFASETPFELEGITKASRSLHVFSGGALGDADSLRLVGDAAAAVGQPLEELSFWIGRAYSMIKGGQPFGEAAMRLQEMGLMTPAVRQQMEALQASGASVSEVWGVLATRMSEFKGGMEKMSKTGDGLVSTLKDTVTEAKRTFGQEFVDAAKVAIDAITQKIASFIEDGSIKKWAQKSLEYIYLVAGAIKAIWEGGEDRKVAFGAMKDVVVGAFELAAKSAVNMLIENGPSIGLSIGKAIAGVFKALTSPSMEKNMHFKAALQTGALDTSDATAVKTALLPMSMWGIADDKKEAVNALAQELIDKKIKEDAKKNLSLLSPSSSRLDNGLAALKGLSDKFKGNVDLEAKKINDLFADNPSKPKPTLKPLLKVDKDLAEADKLVKAKKAAEDEKKRISDEEKARIEMAKKLDEERQKLLQKELIERLKANSVEASDMQKRLSTAQAQVQKAWGWYRDKDSMKKQMEEEKNQAKAEVQFEKDLDRLARRKGDWRTAKGLSVDDEATRRLGVAKEEERNAQKALTQIEENTRDLSEKLDELLSMKGGG
jgi:hypothetical protein